MGIHYTSRTMFLSRHSETDVVSVVQRHSSGLLLLERGDEAAQRQIDDVSAHLATTHVLQSEATANLWHLRTGHLGPEALGHLTEQVTGTRLKGPATVECDSCGQAKARAVVSRHDPGRRSNLRPLQELHVDWTDYEQDNNGYSRAMYITDASSGYVFHYYHQGKAYGFDFTAILQDLYSWAVARGFRILTIRSDAELMSSPVKRWASRVGVTLEASAPRTAAQNGIAERSGGGIAQTARTLRISAHLPPHLWREASQSAVYLLNRSPKRRLGWKTPFEALFGQRPKLHHLRTYGCKAYALTEDAQSHRNKKKRLDPRAYVGYLVGYMSTNIFRIWVPSTGKVLVTRDVSFNEADIYQGHLPQQEPTSVREVEMEQILDISKTTETDDDAYIHFQQDMIHAREAADSGGGSVQATTARNETLPKKDDELIDLPTPPESPHALAVSRSR